MNFGLKTKTEDFIEYLNAQPIYNEVGGALDVLNCYGVDWHDYEQSLNDIDLDEIEFQNEIPPDYSSDHEYDRDGGILNMQMYVDSISNAINAALEQMVIDANNGARRLSMMVPKRKIFRSGDAILSFNYTSTIEYLFAIPHDVSIFHIHGYYENGAPLIFGYRRTDGSYKSAWTFVDEENADYYISQQREAVYTFYESWRKKLQTDNLRVFLSCCHEIDKVIVLGHSMSSVDAEYMEEIERVLCPRCWDVSYYKVDDIENVRFQGYSFEKKINFSSMAELMKNCM